MRISLGRIAFAFGATALCMALLGALLFGIAGRWDLTWFQAYVAVYGLMCLSGLLFIDKGLIKERFRPGGKARDAAPVGTVKVLAVLHYAVAALDVGRYHWSAEIPVALQLAALVLFALSALATNWTMVVNRFFSSVVRIQEERGHHVVTDGPYRIVRHPGYTMILVMLLTSGVALGSWWSILPMGVAALLIIRRTALEDRFLHDNLDGYSEYARRVRHRLVPSVW